MATDKYYNQPATVYGMSTGRKRKIFDLLGSATVIKILDIGCGNGQLGAELRAKGNLVLGIDISQASAALASKVLDQVIVCDIENADWTVPDSSIDVVIISEVIEHLFFPEVVLGKINRVLKPGGRVIVTTPNFLVFSNRIKMLLGQFRYTETGFFDRGHIHFFTKQTLERCLAEAGFVVARYNNIYHGKIPEWLGRLWPSLFAYQFAFVAVKK